MPSECERAGGNMLFAWLILLLRLGITPNLFITFLVDENPFVSKVFVRIIYGLGDIIGNLTTT
jgi:hypothetical protein